jgi:lysophospholipase L1-like esterase
LILLLPSIAFAQVVPSNVQLPGLTIPGNGIAGGTLPVIYVLGDSITVGIGDLQDVTGMGFRNKLQAASRLGKTFEFVGEWGPVHGNTDIASGPVLMPVNRFITAHERGLPPTSLQGRMGGWGGAAWDPLMDFVIDTGQIAKWFPAPIHEDSTFLILTGTNDAVDLVTANPATAESFIPAIVASILSFIDSDLADINVVVLDGIPVNLAGCEPSCAQGFIDVAAWMVEFSDQLTIAIEADPRFGVDLYLVDTFDAMDSDDYYNAGDIIHPNTAGYVILADLIYTEMQEYIDN